MPIIEQKPKKKVPAENKKFPFKKLRQTQHTTTQHPDARKSQKKKPPAKKMEEEKKKRLEREGGWGGRGTTKNSKKAKVVEKVVEKGEGELEEKLDLFITHTQIKKSPGRPKKVMATHIKKSPGRPKKVMATSGGERAKRASFDEDEQR